MRVVGLLITSVVLANVSSDYKEAVSIHSGNAVVLLVQDNCAPCRRLENDIVSIMRQAGIMTDSSVHIISVNEDSELVNRLQGSGINARRGFPVILVYRRVNKKQWAWRYIGYSESSVVVQWMIGVKKWKIR